MLLPIRSRYPPGNLPAPMLGCLTKTLSAAARLSETSLASQSRRDVGGVGGMVFGDISINIMPRKVCGTNRAA